MTATLLCEVCGHYHFDTAPCWECGEDGICRTPPRPVKPHRSGGGHYDCGHPVHGRPAPEQEGET